MAQDQHHPHTHDGSELSPIELRVRALESILTEKGYVDPALSTPSSRPTRPRSARATAQRWSRKPGPILSSAPAPRRCDRRDRLSGLRRTAGRAHDCAREHPETFTTSSSAPCAPAIHGRCLGCRRSGKVPPISVAGCSRPAGRPGRVRGDAAQDNPHPGVGLHRGAPLPGPCRCARMERRAGVRRRWPILSPATP